MKKIFYFIASAIVALGAVACQNDINENIENNQQTEGLSFTATIDDITRVVVDKSDIEGYDKKLSWEGNETIVVSDSDFKNSFDFKNTKATPNIFTCTDEGVNVLVGKTVSLRHGDCTSATFYNAHAEGSANSMYLTSDSNIENFATEEMGEIKMCVGQQLFRLECNEVVTLKMYTEWNDLGSIFFYDWENDDDDPKEEVVFAAGEHYFSANAAEDVTIEAYINGVKVKETSGKDLYDTSVIYNLGEIKAELCDFTIVGGHQGWDTANGDVMYKIAGSNTYMRSDVALNEQGFKFYNATTETIIEEHPAVTVGEEGDWYLKPSSNWKADGARFAIYFFGNGETWVSMKDDNGDGIYVANNPIDGKDYPNMIFCRMNPSNETNNWDNKWNQTADLTAPTDGNNLYTVKEGTWDKGGGTWSVHTPEKKDAWTEEVEKVIETWFGYNTYGGDYKTGWAQNWSNSDDKGGDIKVDDINKTYDIYFSLGEKQDWGFAIYYTVLEHGSPAPELK